MEISLRECVWRGERTWEDYLPLRDLSHLSRIRTADVGLNPYVGEPIFLFPPDDDVLTALCALPGTDSSPRCYYLLAINVEEETTPVLPASAVFLGYDVCNFGTSSLLNCGQWEGKLLPITERLNDFGLLTLDDAKLAQALLPEEWGEDEPHACVDIWVLYDITGMRSKCSGGQNRVGSE